MTSASLAKRLFPVVLGLVCAATTSRAEEEVMISAVRPVEEALTKLEREFGVPITYEEAPYLFAEDAEALVRRKPRTLQFSYLTIAMRAVEIKANIQHVLDANNNSGRPPMIFAVKEAGGRFHVYTTKRKNEEGKYVPYDSPLDTIISIERKPRNELEFLDEFFAALFGITNTQLYDARGIAPSNLERRTDSGGENKAARELLLQYFVESERGLWGGGKASWRLLCAGISSTCSLSLHSVQTISHEAAERPETDCKGNPQLLGTVNRRPSQRPSVILPLLGAPRPPGGGKIKCSPGRSDPKDEVIK